MRIRIFNLIGSYLCFGLVITFAFPVQEEISAEEIIQNVEKLFRGSTSHGIFELHIKTEDWQRSITIESWAVGTEKSFIRILSPKKEKGIGFLKVGSEMWQYLPKVRRTIKIPPSMMLASWMGSDFTNDDLARESSIMEDYTHTLIGISEYNAEPVYELALTAKPNAPVVWSKIQLLCRKSDFIPLRENYYDESGKVVRTVIFSDMKLMGDRIIPTTMTLTKPDEPENFTRLIYHEIEFDLPIANSVFTLKNLKK